MLFTQIHLTKADRKVRPLRLFIYTGGAGRFRLRPRCRSACTLSARRTITDIYPAHTLTHVSSLCYTALFCRNFEDALNRLYVDGAVPHSLCGISLNDVVMNF